MVEPRRGVSGIWPGLSVAARDGEAPWSAYERAPAPLVDDNFRKAIARRSLGRTSAGREILQRTRTSARDFEYVDPLRRSLDR